MDGENVEWLGRRRGNTGETQAKTHVRHNSTISTFFLFMTDFQSLLVMPLIFKKQGWTQSTLYFPLVPKCGLCIMYEKSKNDDPKL